MISFSQLPNAGSIPSKKSDHHCGPALPSKPDEKKKDILTLSPWKLAEHGESDQRKRPDPKDHYSDVYTIMVTQTQDEIV